MNIMAMMKQAQTVQAKMQDAQARIAQMEFVGQSGGGAVQITLSGKNEARKVQLDASVVNAAEKDMLEDLILAAINDARSKSEAATASEMKAAMGGLNLPPGLNLPF